jgi:hypothetical protein
VFTDAPASNKTDIPYGEPGSQPEHSAAPETAH